MATRSLEISGGIAKGAQWLVNFTLCTRRYLATDQSANTQMEMTAAVEKQNIAAELMGLRGNSFVEEVASLIQQQSIEFMAVVDERVDQHLSKCVEWVVLCVCAHVSCCTTTGSCRCKTRRRNSLKH